MKRIYIAGPMSGLPDFNYPAFHAAAQRLRDLGFNVENPADNPEPHCGSWLGYMRMAIRQLAQCDGVALLPGWESSRGARIEQQLATQLGLIVVPESAIQHGPEFADA
jgi:Domain of unknown function (DUF4406)